jgi:hypothetical protein
MARPVFIYNGQNKREGLFKCFSEKVCCTFIQRSNKYNSKKIHSAPELTPSFSTPLWVFIKSLN